MKHSANYYDLKKGKTQPSKKPVFLNSLIYKQVTTNLTYKEGTSNLSQLLSKPKPSSKETISRDKRSRQEEKVSKKTSFNGLNKKSSKGQMSHFEMVGLYNKLTDNYMAETQQDTHNEAQINSKDRKDENKHNSKHALQQPIKQPYVQYQPHKHYEHKNHKQSYQHQRQYEHKHSNQSMKHSIKLSKTIQLVEGKIEKALFNYLYIIGKGGFGKVWKVQHKKTKNQYAMKQMLKSIVMTKKSVQSVMNQRVLLSQINSPFLVNMHFAFQDRDTLYLVLDLMEGGDLRYHIGNRVFSQIQAKFFIACIVLGLEDMQNHNIIHRDIKPENLVLDSRGYIRITDLGIARLLKANNSSDTSGTPGYMSPEVICRMNHGFVSDYFALGVIAYQLMTGKRPYNGRSRNQIRELMLAKQIQLRYHQIPQDWSAESANFINSLIQRKPQQRLGFSGIQQIKSHPWLQGLSWDKLRSKEIQSPFIPMMKKSNFDQDEQITIQDEQEAQMIQKNSLLLRKPQFQQLFASYYYASTSNYLAQGGNQSKDKDKKSSAKRVISAYRRSQQDPKAYQLLPEKKLSYNEVVNKKRVELNKAEKGKPLDLLLGLKEKKRSGQFQQNFFR